ncbi:helix-turn-helix domain-containing protein [endosymbiont 'TC1' of Trimyema compressum]|uniref:helix-turn-helix domain-containing protein n=1 Tax=endosymbiont 'TC1' of Trimyema compressum TaxID=243899 RepID=UPI003CCC0528
MRYVNDYLCSVFRNTQKRNITKYQLIFNHGIPANTLQCMLNGEAITTKTIDTLCFILECETSDIIKHDNSQ